MSESDDLVKVRAVTNIGQLRLAWGAEGTFPRDQVQPFLNRGRAVLVDPPKPKRRSKKNDDDGDATVEVRDDHPDDEIGSTE